MGRYRQNKLNPFTLRQYMKIVKLNYNFFSKVDVVEENMKQSQIHLRTLILKGFTDQNTQKNKMSYTISYGNSFQVSCECGIILIVITPDLHTLISLKFSIHTCKLCIHTSWMENEMIT